MSSKSKLTTLNQRFQHVRFALKLQKEEVAKQLGVSVEDITEYENGKDIPSSVLGKFFTAYNVYPNWLFKGTGDRFGKGIEVYRQMARNDFERYLNMCNCDDLEEYINNFP